MIRKAVGEVIKKGVAAVQIATIETLTMLIVIGGLQNKHSVKTKKDMQILEEVGAVGDLIEEAAVGAVIEMIISAKRSIRAILPKILLKRIWIMTHPASSKAKTT